MPPRGDAGELAAPGHTEVPGCQRLDAGCDQGGEQQGQGRAGRVQDEHAGA